jgi:hypothetical protein
MANGIMAHAAPIAGRGYGQYSPHAEIANKRILNVLLLEAELVALDSVVGWRPTKIPREKTMYKLAVAILLLSAPAFAQDKSEYKPDMPANNMKNTVIPKSGGTQTPATTPTKAGETTPPDTTASRPAKNGPEQASVPNSNPPATASQTTGESNQSPTVKKMNEDEKKKIETEGK